jgi:hypothetical protein
MLSNLCLPLDKVLRAEPGLVKKIGMVLTDLDRPSAGVFRRFESPDCQIAIVRPVSSAYDGWRETLLLDSKFSARAKGWPVVVTLRPGLDLCPEVGLDRWEADRSFLGFLGREPRYVELATYLLEITSGFSLELPGGKTAVVISDGRFDGAVSIGEPVHLAGSPALA